MRYAALIAIAVLTVGLVSAQRAAPSFESYLAAVEEARTKTINLRSHRAARRFRTVLNQSLGDGVNFAGHYVLAEWGCGTACTIGAVIDVRNGHVYFPDELAGRYLGCTYDADDEPTIFRLNSRLLVMSGSPASRRAKPCGRYYYEWTKNRFRLVKFIEKNN